MNIKISTLILLLILLLITGFSQRSNGKGEALLNAEFKLRVGREARIKGQGLTVSFSSVVEDSRCPQGVDCMWAGNAVAVLKLSRANADSITVELNTNLEPKEKSYQQYEISLIALNPYPKKDSRIKREDYIGTFVVRKASN
ncbi:MAG TPA: hypothetical protein VKC34_00130 [Blastocatellia bacterium]|nr:hypothetical protein [Blastocatellia bacterium]